MIVSPEVYVIADRDRDHEPRRYVIHDGPGHAMVTMDREVALQAARDGHEVLTMRPTTKR